MEFNVPKILSGFEFERARDAIAINDTEWMMEKKWNDTVCVV